MYHISCELPATEPVVTHCDSEKHYQTLLYDDSFLGLDGQAQYFHNLLYEIKTVCRSN